MSNEVIDLRARRARIVCEMDSLYDRMNDCNRAHLAAKLHTLAELVNRLDARLIGTPST
jgi:hypothetical protein